MKHVRRIWERGETFVRGITSGQRKNLGNSLIFMGGSGIEVLIRIFSSPIFARYMSESDFAVFSYFTSLISFFSPIYTMLYLQYYIIQYFRQTKEENEEMLHSLLHFMMLANMLVSFVAYGAMFVYFYTMDVSFPLLPHAVIILVTMFAQGFQIFLLSVFKIRKQAFYYLFLHAGSRILVIGISLYLVVYHSMGGLGRLLGAMIAFTLTGTISFLLLRRNERHTFNWKVIKDAIKVCSPLLLGAFLTFPLKGLDKIMLERLGNVTAFGLYSIGFRYSSFLNFVFRSIGSAFQPDVSKFIVRNEKKKLALLMSGLIVMYFLVVSLFILFIRPLVDFLSAGRYLDAIPYAKWNAIAVLAYNLMFFPRDMVLLRKWTRTVFMVDVASALIALGLMYVCIHRWQFMGAIYSLILSNLLIAMIYVVVLVVRTRLLKSKEQKARE